MWEVDEDILTIWGVHKGSPAAFKGEFGVTPATPVPATGGGWEAATGRPRPGSSRRYGPPSINQKGDKMNRAKGTYTFGERPQHVLRGLRHRRTADPAAWQRRRDRDVRRGPAAARRRPAGCRHRFAGLWAYVRHRPPAELRVNGGRCRHPHRSPRLRRSRPHGPLPGRAGKRDVVAATPNQIFNENNDNSVGNLYSGTHSSSRRFLNRR